MSDDRTPEQREADAVFEEAIVELLKAYDSADGPLMEWVLVTSTHHMSGEGTSSTAVGNWVNPGQPLHRSLGLLDYTATRLRAHIAGNADIEGPM